MSTRPPCDTSKLSTRDISIEGGVRQRWMVRQRPSVLEGDLRSIRTCQGRIQCRERGELEWRVGDKAKEINSSQLTKNSLCHSDFISGTGGCQ